MEPVIFASIIVSGSLLLAATAIALAVVRSRREPQAPAADQLILDAWREAIDRLERRLGRLESSLRSAQARGNSVDSIAPLKIVESVAPPIELSGERSAGETLEPPTEVSAAPHTKRSFQAAEICRLAERGRNPIEIAQLVGADVGEVELVLQLEKAARAELT